METVHNIEGHHGYLLDVVRDSPNEAYVQIHYLFRSERMRCLLDSRSTLEPKVQQPGQSKVNKH